MKPSDGDTVCVLVPDLGEDEIVQQKLIKEVRNIVQLIICGPNVQQSGSEW